MTNPYYLHPNEGTLAVSEKLQGVSNYRSWKRTMEIALAGKRKLGFVTRRVKRDPADVKKQELCDTCNSVVMSWLHASMNESIKKSVLYYTRASDIWEVLEKRFTVSNRATKYRLNKKLYEMEQNGRSINEYYTMMCGVWEELEELNQTPAITEMNPEIRAYIEALKMQKEEQHLFQFLYGLDESYAQQRSQILMRTPLPTVEEACAQLQQEEAQREVLGGTQILLESSAMSTKLSKLTEQRYHPKIKKKNMKNNVKYARRGTIQQRTVGM
ncbi:Retrovirus-related Pol polyprotein from transposon RE1 [Bienertia sinuspersici]